jgi:hypothetical protein
LKLAKLKPISFFLSGTESKVYYGDTPEARQQLLPIVNEAGVGLTQWQQSMT